MCRWNRKFSQELPEHSSFQTRPFLDGNNAVTLARESLTLDQEQFSTVFRKSPMKRAKLTGLRRNVAVVPANEAEH